MESSKEQSKVSKENKAEEEEELITDFSSMFKGKGAPRRMPKLSSKQVEQTPNWLLEIPAKLQITKDELCQRKVLDQRRWKSLAKHTEESHIALSAAVSSWNYLFSSKGVGELPPITVKSAIELLTLREITFVPQNEFDRTNIVLNIFDCLCNQFKSKAKGNVIMKPCHPNKVEINREEGLRSILLGLKKESHTYVLITSTTILCPIGFDKTPLLQLDAYKKLDDIKEENIELWIVNGSLHRFAPSFISKRWKDIEKCLETAWPNYIDIQEPKKGVQRHPKVTPETQSEERGSSCCILEFQRESS